LRARSPGSGRSSASRDSGRAEDQEVVASILHLEGVSVNGSVGIAETDLLLVVDIQNDFCSRGALGVPHGEDVVPVVNDLARRFDHVVLTQDWHPPGHHSFASAHAGKKPFETVDLAYGPQILWPDHCVQATPGAAFHRDMQIPHAALVIRKGFRTQIDSYSTFYENDRKTPTGLAGYLRERGFQRVFLAGLAFDFCVRYSAEDARREGFAVIVVEDACRAIDLDGSAVATREAFTRLGVECIHADAVG
jgi:nicotinamidase/pyrazinamidase